MEPIGAFTAIAIVMYKGYKDKTYRSRKKIFVRPRGNGYRLVVQQPTPRIPPVAEGGPRTTQHAAPIPAFNQHFPTKQNTLDDLNIRREHLGQ